MLAGFAYLPSALDITPPRQRAPRSRVAASASFNSRSPRATTDGGEGGPICRCGNIGCFEALAGGWALHRGLRALGHEVESSFDVVRLIRAGHPDAVRLARQAGRVLGQAISDAVSFFNPSL